MFAANTIGIEVLFVDLNLGFKFGDVRHVDFDRTIPKRFHELVVLKLFELRFVGVTDNDFIDIGLRKLLGLDLVLLRSTEQIVQEGHIELKNFDELNDTTISDVEFAVEIKRARI